MLGMRSLFGFVRWLLAREPLPAPATEAAPDRAARRNFFAELLAAETLPQDEPSSALPAAAGFWRLIAARDVLDDAGAEPHAEPYAEAAPRSFWGWLLARERLDEEAGLPRKGSKGA